MVGIVSGKAAFDLLLAECAILSILIKFIAVILHYESASFVLLLGVSGVFGIGTDCGDGTVGGRP